LQEFWLRVDMSTQSATSPLCLRGLQITVGYQLNMNILPRLIPGENKLYLQADKLDGVKLSAEWAFTHPEGERVETVTLEKAGRAARTINPIVKKPDELIMRGVTLRCDAVR